MEITKLSTKGQIVIPEEIRNDLEIGTAFVVSRQKNMIILKKVEGLTKEEIEEMKELNKIWEEIDRGECITQNADEFLKDLEKWAKE